MAKTTSKVRPSIEDRNASSSNGSVWMCSRVRRNGVDLVAPRVQNRHGVTAIDQTVHNVGPGRPGPADDEDVHVYSRFA